MSCRAAGPTHIMLCISCSVYHVLMCQDDLDIMGHKRCCTYKMLLEELTVYF